LSIQNANSTALASEACREGKSCWGIFENYHWALTSSEMLKSYRNNIIWMVVAVPGTLVLGLLIAVLTDRVKYERIAKAIIFMPMAISFVGAGVIWSFVYAYPRNPNDPHSPIIGVLNAIVVALGGHPVSWLSTPTLNVLMLNIVGIWLWTGFNMTILSAALRGVPTEVIEAARIDGANEFQVFFRIMIPLIMPTIVLVITTMTITVLKVFDIVYVMTGGNYGSDVIANRMYMEMYVRFDAGRSSAIAVVLIGLIVPVMILNMRRIREQEARR
jgi:alpha-glucoside transport system permease protein